MEHFHPATLSPRHCFTGERCPQHPAISCQELWAKCVDVCTGHHLGTIQHLLPCSASQVFLIVKDLSDGSSMPCFHVTTMNLGLNKYASLNCSKASPSVLMLGCLQIDFKACQHLSDGVCAFSSSCPVPSTYATEVEHRCIRNKYMCTAQDIKTKCPHRCCITTHHPHSCWKPSAHGPSPGAEAVNCRDVGDVKCDGLYMPRSLMIAL